MTTFFRKSSSRHFFQEANLIQNLLTFDLTPLTFPYTCLSALIGSILDALRAGWRLAITEIRMTMREITSTSVGAALAVRRSPVSLPKLKVILEKLRIVMMMNPR